jgi:uncharacterized repeat protein (TIGR01451 family)
MKILRTTVVRLAAAIAFALLVTVYLSVPQPALAQGGITITKAADRMSVSPGDVVTYTITVRNTGSSRSVTVWDQIPFAVEYVDGSATGGATYSSGPPAQVTWSGTIDTDETVVFTFQVFVVEPETVGPLCFTNQAHSDEASSNIVEVCSGRPPPDGDEDTWPEPVLRKRVEPTQALPGEQVVFTIDVTNEGEEAAVGVVVTDEVPEYLEILGVTATQGAVHVEGQTVWVEVGTIGPGFWVEIVIITRVRDDVPRPHEMENVATMRAHNTRDRETSPILITVPADGMPTTGGDAWIVWLVCIAAFSVLTAWVVWENYREPPEGQTTN